MLNRIPTLAGVVNNSNAYRKADFGADRSGRGHSVRYLLLHTDICEMAAAYLFRLVQNHPFVDGNKRTGAVSTLVFLALNGFDFDAPEDDLAEMVLSVAWGELAKAGVAVFIQRFTRPA